MRLGAACAVSDGADEYKKNIYTQTHTYTHLTYARASIECETVRDKTEIHTAEEKKTKLRERKRKTKINLTKKKKKLNTSWGAIDKFDYLFLTTITQWRASTTITQYTEGKRVKTKINKNET